ncbi:MAG: glucose-6-phosphate isomerase [Deltaproteobacteria bacterium]|nr:glucose-6-phosphate isomerase [Deltaproteobacteria bacterium]
MRLKGNNVISRIWAHDHTVWKSDPREITDRLGWLNIMDTMREEVETVGEFVDSVRRDGYRQALLLGMGGSSLAPEVFGKAFAVRDGYLKLSVLDSTDPETIYSRLKGMDLNETLFIVSTKSGTTTETLSLFKYCYNNVLKSLGREFVGKHFIAITDPGTPLVDLAERYHFRKIFLNAYDIGGRYSVLSYFGLVPAALMGIDIKRLLDKTSKTAANCMTVIDSAGENNYGADLGAALGELAMAGRDKVTFVVSQRIESFQLWVEQLLAESTGKEGKGILPVAGEEPGVPEDYGCDRVFISLELAGEMPDNIALKTLEQTGHPVIRITLDDLYDMGGQFFLWEMATAVAGHIMRINPFDQPDVESAKIRTREVMENFRRDGKLPREMPDAIDGNLAFYGTLTSDDMKESMEAFLSKHEDGAYLALHVYLKQTVETDRIFGDIRSYIRKKFRMATTLGYGPSFLHSTGQLHKGDAGKGLFIQITGDDSMDLPIPDTAGEEKSSISFGTLKAAQAMGDRRALDDLGRRVIRIHIGGDVIAGLKHLRDIL